MKEYVAYEGESYVIEWYYDAAGVSDVLEYFENMTDTQKRKALMLFKRMGDFGRINDITKFRNEGDKIFAFKPQPDRYLSFFCIGKKIVLTNAFHKKSDKLPSTEKDRAINRMKDYEMRVKKGEYYEK
jgi:phage-related protein